MRASKACQMLVQHLAIQTGNFRTLQVLVPSRPGTGPKDEYISLVNTRVNPDDKGDFINHNYSSNELDAVHTFATSRITVDLWENALDKNIIWSWGKSPLKVDIQCEDIDATFDRREQTIKFGHSGKSNTRTCQAIDIVAHETTHAIIDSLKPGIHDGAEFKSLAWIETICDLSALLVKILVIGIDSEINYLTPNEFTEFAYGYRNDNKRTGLRSTLSIIPQKDDSKFYELSTRLTNEIFANWLKKGYLKPMKGRITNCMDDLISKLDNIKKNPRLARGFSFD